ncbi:YesL family protein [Ornithinibacillus xuwenensis]|uniref:DUF624 domain-containing protein n=1 Tax=Ornithinibacillus xuwenensis TaxID=3144668 RepID=A0ABU9XLU8_9BACI
MNTASSRLYHILDWITKFAYVNVLWIFFTLVGGILFGLFPSTTAMFAITRDWLRGKTDIPIFHSYWSYYKREFMNSNKLGIVIALMIVLIVVDFAYIQSIMNHDFPWIAVPLFASMLLFLLFMFYLFPAFVHYDISILPLLKNAFLIMLINPIHSFFILLCLVSIYFVMRFIPALFFIFGGSVYAFITMWLALHAFQKISRKKAAS